MSASSGDNRMSATQIMKHMFKAEGVPSFFKGWTPAFIRLGPQTIITFVVLEQFKTWYDLFQQDRQLTTTTTTPTTSTNVVKI